MSMDKYDEIAERLLATANWDAPQDELREHFAAELRKQGESAVDLAVIAQRQGQRIEKLEGVLHAVIAGQWVLTIDDMVARARAALEDDDEKEDESGHI